MSAAPDPAIITGQLGSSAYVSPQPGMQYPVVAPADPTGKMMSGCSTLLYLPPAAYTSAIPAQCMFSTQYITSAAFDVTVVSFQGGVSPTITFLFSRQGADGAFYPILPALGQPGAATLAAPATVSVDIGLLPQSSTGGGTSPVYGAAHNVFTPVSLVTWNFGGSSLPTSVTFSLSIIGR